MGKGYKYAVLIEEGFKQKPRQRSSRLFGGQIPCRASYFTSVVLKETVEFILLLCFLKMRSKVNNIEFVVNLCALLFLRVAIAELGTRDN